MLNVTRTTDQPRQFSSLESHVWVDVKERIQELAKKTLDMDAHSSRLPRRRTGPFMTIQSPNPPWGKPYLPYITEIPPTNII